MKAMMMASLARWRVGYGESCHHHCCHCCWLRCGRSRGGDRESFHGVGAQTHIIETELLTTFQEVAIVGEVIVIKDKTSCGVDPYTQIWARGSQAPALSSSAFDFGFYMFYECSIQ
uniref:Uncharacterized protein n=1 Tax=Oryza punctata TaxID=4537 RepID=A0A0E0L039_ORYPU